ncbi:MAG: CinA family protein, partial [candidate division NC10 bacterium]
ARPDEARRLTGDADATGSAGERAERLAEAVRKWSGVEIGLATVFEDVPDTTPPVTVVGIAVALAGRRAGREHRLGGDRPSLRIRTATLALDLLRRSLP